MGSVGRLMPRRWFLFHRAQLRSGIFREAPEKAFASWREVFVQLFLGPPLFLFFGLLVALFQDYCRRRQKELGKHH